MIVAEPLTYDNAIRYEKYGFDYLRGKQLMLEIDREFQPGGTIFFTAGRVKPLSDAGYGAYREREELGYSRRHHGSTVGRGADLP